MIEQYAYDICALLIFISWACGAILVPLFCDWLHSIRSRKKL